MSLLYSKIPPARIFDDEKIFADLFRKKLAVSNELCIGVGYISKASLAELERLAASCGLKKVTLIIGMFFIEGYPEKLYHQTMKLAAKWKAE